VHLVGFTTEIYYDALPYERHIWATYNFRVRHKQWSVNNSVNKTERQSQRRVLTIFSCLSCYMFRLIYFKPQCTENIIRIYSRANIPLCLRPPKKGHHSFHSLLIPLSMVPLTYDYNLAPDDGLYVGRNMKQKDKIFAGPWLWLGVVFKSCNHDYLYVFSYSRK